MKALLSVFLLFCSSLCLNGQSQDSTITLGRFFLSTTYTFQGEELTLKGVSETVAQNKEAHDFLQSALGYKAAGNLLGFAGGLVVGFQLARFIADDPSINKTMLITGFGALALSIPLNLQAAHEARKGIKVYNDGLAANSQSKSALQLRLGYSGNGLKLVLNF